MKLTSPYMNQGYRLYIDNFYTSPQLLKDLYASKVHSTGTMASNRKGYLEQIKRTVSSRMNQVSIWERMRLFSICGRTRNVLLLQVQSTQDTLKTLLRGTGKKGERKKRKYLSTVNFRYTKYMGGVDCSDQFLKYYEVVWQTKKYWKTFFSI